MRNGLGHESRDALAARLAFPLRRQRQCKKLLDGTQAQLSQHILTMGLDGAVADIQFSGDLFAGAAHEQFVKHLASALRQQAEKLIEIAVPGAYLPRTKVQRPTHRSSIRV